MIRQKIKVMADTTHIVSEIETTSRLTGMTVVFPFIEDGKLRRISIYDLFESLECGHHSNPDISTSDRVGELYSTGPGFEGEFDHDFPKSPGGRGNVFCAKHNNGNFPLDPRFVHDSVCFNMFYVCPPQGE